VAAGLVDAASVRRSSVRHSVSAAVAADCQSVTVSPLPLYRRPASDCRPCETTSSVSREARSTDLRPDLDRSFLTRQTNQQLQ